MVSNLAEVLPPRWSAKARSAQFLIAIAPLIMVAGLLVAKTVDPWWYWHIFVREDGPGEWLTAIVYLLAAPLAALLSMRLFRNDFALHATLAAVLAFGLFFIGMEEISWGQRVFGFSTPEALAAINRQQELNLHNIGERPELLSSAFLLVSGFALTAFYWLPSALDHLFSSRFPGLAQLIAPPRFLAFYFAPVFLVFGFFLLNPVLIALFGPAWGIGYSPEDGLFMLARDQEPVECIMAFGFFLFTLWLLLLQSRGRWQVDYASK